MIKVSGIIIYGYEKLLGEGISFLLTQYGWRIIQQGLGQMKKNYPDALFQGILRNMNILLVAPYPDLMNHAKQVVPSLPYEVMIIEGNLQKGLQAAQQVIQEQPVQVVISRGGTATLLKRHISLPVFEIEVSGYDLLRVIYPHALRHSKIAVIGYENVINGAKSIASILDIDLGYFLIDKRIQTVAVVEQAHAWGAEVIIGDTISVNTARELGLESELVRSGPEAIQSAIESSVVMIERMNEEIVRNKRLNIMMEQSDMGILYIATDGLVQLVNSKAEKMLNRSKAYLIGHELTVENSPALLLELLASDKSNKLINIDGKDYMVEVKRIRDQENSRAILIFIQSSSRIKDLEGMLRKEMVARGLVAQYSFDSITAIDHSFLQVVEKARTFSHTNATILILGETGSGKEMFAQSIHNASKRHQGPFVAVNCAALPDSLLESELFGYAEGAFTGAQKGGKPGLFELAHKGTIFLDEVNDMNKNVQARMLRVLQEKQVMRLGGNRVYDVDVRVIAACNKDLFAETESGQFRKDLYYRIKVLDIKLPPLRERLDDVLPLFESFLTYFNTKYGYQVLQIPPQLKQAVLMYSWPGNVRQLRNFAEKVSVLFSLSDDTDAVVDDLIKDFESEGNTQPCAFDKANGAFDEYSVRRAEMEVIRSCWIANDQNISKTARTLGLDRSTVRKHLEEYL